MVSLPNKQDKHGPAVIKRGGRKQHAEEHGSAWKVAFADFCLALMCLFLVLWVMAAREQERVELILRSVESNRMNEGAGIMPETLGGPRGSLIERLPIMRSGESSMARRAKKTEFNPDREPAIKTRYESVGDLQILSRLLASLSADAGLSSNLQTIITPYGLRVMLHDTDRQGMFVRGGAVPTDRFQKLLRKMGPLFAQMENQILIVGHTDSLQYASQNHAAYSNWTLSSNRAMAARANLLAGQMPPDSILQVVGMADRAPLEINDPTASINRRIELLILTSGQAASIAAMFGMPADTAPLMEDVSAAFPDRDALKKLRDLIRPAKGGVARAN